ncbi:MAG: alpha/beta hydrolase [Candidatus Micrarchaeota archaeon]|nr:alpha/beta hydrolase [Candidatus Micrarchaeota archaeon]
MEGFEDFEENFSVTRKGRLFFLHRAGEGQAIIFLHGVGATVRTWRKLVPFIPANLDVYLVDLLGHGRSDSPVISYDIMVQVNALKDMTSSLGLHEPVLFGHSYGAWLATHYAATSNTKGVILEDSAGLEAQANEIIDSGKRDEYLNGIVKESLKIGANEAVMRSIASNFDKYMLNKEVLSKVTTKTLLIWGSNDEVVPLRFGEWERGLIPHNRFMVIKGGGHIPHWTIPVDTGRAIAQFCGEV